MSFLQEIVVVSGRSGAGKTTASRALEDMGYFVVDNLPPQLLPDLLTLASASRERIEKIAVVIDVRETEFLEEMPKKWRELNDTKYLKKLIFLDATDQQLIDRYQETKRRHPLDNGEGVRAALKLEQQLLEPIREIATREIFTDKLNSHELRNLIKHELMALKDNHLNITLMSFGFKHGVPSELDLCFDVRFLTNPYYRLELRRKSGLDKEVFDFVVALPAANQFLDKISDLIDFLYPLYREEGKAGLTIAIGCTGGQHRSTSLVEALKTRLAPKYEHMRIVHRDLERNQ